MSAASTPSRGPGRDLSIDIAKGLAMVMVVLGHVARGVTSAGISPYSEAWQTLDRGLYLCHLSVFAFLAGLFLRQGLEKRGAREFLTQRMMLFGWLFVVWSLIQGGVKVATGSLVNSPVSLGDVLMLWRPDGQMWFFGWLITATLLGVLVGPWRYGWAAVALLAALVGGIAVWGFEPEWIFTRGGALYVPFLLGCAVGAQRFMRWAAETSVVNLILLVAGGAGWICIAGWTAATPPTTGGADRTSQTVLLGVAGCVLGTVAVLLIAKRLASAGLLAKALAYVGVFSLEILLAHITVAAGTRIVLQQLGVTDVAVYLVLGVGMGVTVPIALKLISGRLGWTWLFALPRIPHTAKA